MARLLQWLAVRTYRCELPRRSSARGFPVDLVMLVLSSYSWDPVAFAITAVGERAAGLGPDAAVILVPQWPRSTIRCSQGIPLGGM